MNKTVLSRNAYASRASTSRVETAQDDGTKNVTVFDKIVMPSQDLTIGIRSGTLTPDKHDTNNTNTIVIADGN